jgi:CDP-diacylglycerol--glycerol-3-phosphate 3-phosphatidyltransferase
LVEYDDFASWEPTMSLYVLKPRFQALLRPRVTRMAGAGYTANQVTLAAAAGSLVVGLGVALLSDLRILFLLLPVWLFIRMALNAIDGMLAREFGQKSPLGAYLNEIADVVSDAALILPFATLPEFGPFWTGAAIVLAVISEFAGVMGPMVGASRRMTGRSARATGPSCSGPSACGSALACRNPAGCSG